MHEMGIAEGIISTARSAAVQHNAKRVQAVNLEIGDANAVIDDSLTMWFTALTEEDPLLKGAVLHITHIPYRAQCRDCHAEFTIEQFLRQCPNCDSLATDIISGTEFMVADIDIDLDTEV